MKLAHAAAAKSSSSATSSPLLHDRGGHERRRAVELGGRLRPGRGLERLERGGPSTRKRHGFVRWWLGAQRASSNSSSSVAGSTGPARRPSACGACGSARRGPHAMRLSCRRMATGTVSRLWRWPVKSMAGEELRALSLGPRGVGGDRTHAVLHEHKGAWRPLTAREAPGLLAWQRGLPVQPRRRAGPRAARRTRSSPSRPACGTGAGATRTCARRWSATSAAPCGSSATSAASRTCRAPCS